MRHFPDVEITTNVAEKSSSTLLHTQSVTSTSELLSDKSESAGVMEHDLCHYYFDTKLLQTLGR